MILQAGSELMEIRFYFLQIRVFLGIITFKMWNGKVYLLHGQVFFSKLRSTIGVSLVEVGRCGLLYRSGCLFLEKSLNRKKNNQDSETI